MQKYYIYIICVFTLVLSVSLSLPKNVFAADEISAEDDHFGYYDEHDIKEPEDGRNTFTTIDLKDPASLEIAMPKKDPRLEGYWKGDCAGAGYFPAKGDDVSLWYSHTGCYNPEERFIDDFNNDGFGPPSERVLNLHPACRKQDSNLKESRDLQERADKDKDDKVTIATVQCLGNDYIDDVDNFCSTYIRDGTSYTKSTWLWDGGCWKKHDQPQFLEITENDKWLPLAYETGGNKNEFDVNSNPYSSRYGHLGEYGFQKRKVIQVDGSPDLLGRMWGTDPWRIVRTNYPYDRRNIYDDGSGTIPSKEAVLSVNNMGVKRKKQECLKVFIEEWAHRGDCGETLIEGARPEINVGHCQWVSEYETTPNFTIPSIAYTAAQILQGNRSGLRSEYYDFEMMNRAGWIPSIPSTVSALDSVSTDICTMDIKPGDGKYFWQTDGLDFSKRGCPTASGYNFWKDSVLNMKNCDMTRGGSILSSDLKYNDILQSSDIDYRIFVFQAAIKWELSTGGIYSIPNILVNILAGDPVPLVDDWADYSWVAATCDHLLNSGTEDQWMETPDYSPLDGDCTSINCDVDGFELGNEFSYFSADTVYDYQLNVSQLYFPSSWCEFEVPYFPYGNGILPNVHPAVAIQPSIVTAGLMNDSANGDDASLQTNFQRVERIRDGCGAFSQRGTWKQDTDTKLSDFLLSTLDKRRRYRLNVYDLVSIFIPTFAWQANKDVGRCQDWQGVLRREYVDPKILSWRMPRFNYEFMKAFIECTGPYVLWQDVCGPPNIVCIITNIYTGNYTHLDDCTTPRVIDVEGAGEEGPGFWCKCPPENILTTRCSEVWCTCEQKEFDEATWDGDVYCDDYGPFKRWLQCYYQARAKACPVLTREVSSGIVSGALTQTPPE